MSANSNSVNFNLEKIFHEVDIEINHSCNRTCWYCPNEKFSRKEKGEMSETLFLEILYQLKQKAYAGKICFHFYNEPLLCSNLNLFVKLTKQHLPKCFLELVSNGMLLSRKHLVELSEIGIDKFTITKHHDVKEIPLDSFFDNLDPSTKAKVKYGLSEKLNLTNRAGLIDLPEDKKLPLSRPCFIPSCMLVITVKGNVLACYEDYEQKSEMGNVLEKNIFDIWNSDHYLNFREDLKKGHRHKYKLCQNCDNLKMIQ